VLRTYVTALQSVNGGLSLPGAIQGPAAAGALLAAFAKRSGADMAGLIEEVRCAADIRREKRSTSTGASG
jgi:hypothetical protein